MKKLSVLLLALIALLAGCQKSEPVALTEVAAHLQKATVSNEQKGNPDELIIDSTHEIVVPINKTGQWPQTDQAPVAVRIVDTGKRLGQKRVVFVVTIRQL